MVRYILFEIGYRKEGVIWHNCNCKRPSQKTEFISPNMADFFRSFSFYVDGYCNTFMLSALSDDAVSGVGAANQYVHIAILILEVVGNGRQLLYHNILVRKDILKHPKFQH